MKRPSALLPDAEAAPQPPPRPAAGGPVVERIAGWSARHRKTALFGWLLLVAGAVVLGNMLGTKNLNSYDPGQAGRAERVLGRPGVVQPPAETVLVQARHGARTVAGDPEIRRAIGQVTAALGAMPKVATGIESPLAPGGGKLISRDGRSALVMFNVAGKPDNADQTVAAAERAVAAVQAAHPGLRVAESGQGSVDRATNNIISSDFRHAEVTSVPITLVLLLCVFGALIAAGIPLLLAGTSVATAISLLAIPSRWLPVGSTTSSVVLLVGMAVGIDYSLFYLRREREERAAGADTYTAVRRAAATSGRAIVVSGLTVMISLAGLFLTGIDVFSGLAVGTIMVVGITVLGSLTALPAALSLLGSWVDRGRIPFLGRRRTAARPSRVWAALARRVVAKPVLFGGAAALALAALAVPALSMRLAGPGFRDLPANIPVVQSLLATQRAFPGGSSPAEVVVTGDNLAGPAVRHAITALQGRAAAGTLLREPVTAALLDHNQVMVVSVPLAGGGTDATSNRALAQLRDQALPATLGTVLGPASPDVMPKPHWKPASIVVGPTESLNENVAPGATTTPFKRCAASLILAFFSGIEPANAVLPRSITSVIPSACGLSEDTDGSTTATGSATIRSLESNAAWTAWTVASWSRLRPWELGLRTLRLPPLKLKRASWTAWSTSLATFAAQVWSAASSILTTAGWPGLVPPLSDTSLSRSGRSSRHVLSAKLAVRGSAVGPRRPSNCSWAVSSC